MEVCGIGVCRTGLGGVAGKRYVSDMATANDFADKLSVDGGTIDRGHDAWLRAKVERGLAESRERAKLISVEQVLRDLSLER